MSCCIYYAFVSCTILNCIMMPFCFANCRHGIIKSSSNSSIPLTIHNELRLLLANALVPNQPRGVNLRRLRWDRDLANAALNNHARLCVENHIRISSRKYDFVGQNIFRTNSDKPFQTSDPDWNMAIQGWFNENVLYTYPNISFGTGHYTQIVWAETMYVGCAFSYFKTDKRPYLPYEKLYVCNYGPGGNRQGEAPYQTGSHGCENLC